METLLTYEDYINIVHGFAGIVCACFYAYAFLHR